MLSDLYCEKFTLICRIPTAPENNRVRLFIKHILTGCAKHDGIYDRTTGTVFRGDNTFTVHTRDWWRYRAPAWAEGRYYALSDNEKAGLYTVSRGDLLIFGEIAEDAPKDIDEFDALAEKYALIGGTVSEAAACIAYRDAQKRIPWRTNHIKIIKG